MSGISEESFTLHCEMALNADTGKNSTKYLTGELGFEHELSSECLPQEADHCIISVQVLEFKTRLLEAVEELHIHRDAELKLEEQISKLVLEKQELEWQKESLQHQMNSLVNQHTESLTAVKNQCDSRIRGIEGEKGKHQLTAELKHKEINSLKEELKLLQLSKYTLQKKLSELEQKLHLQMQTKDNHLNQLSEVEKRFGAVSRKCAAVKQAHGKLEQNVEEALRLNKRLSGVNKKQEDTINCLKKDIEKLNCVLVQSKVSSACKSGEKSFSHTVKEQQMQQLQQKLHVETEINKNLVKETAAMRAENQEVMNSLRQAQRLLQMQTEAVGRVELELSAQREEYQALKREHELLKEKTREKDRFVSLAEEYKKSKTKWEKEMRVALLATGFQRPTAGWLSRSRPFMYAHKGLERAHSLRDLLMCWGPAKQLKNSRQTLESGKPLRVKVTQSTARFLRASPTHAAEGTLSASHLDQKAGPLGVQTAERK